MAGYIYRAFGSGVVGSSVGKVGKEGDSAAPSRILTGPRNGAGRNEESVWGLHVNFMVLEKCDVSHCESAVKILMVKTEREPQPCRR